AIRDALGLYNKQRKRVMASTNSAQCIPTHFISTDPMPPSMLLKDLDSSADSRLIPQDFISGITVQRKLNRVHFVVFLSSCGNKVIGYSRTGRLYPEQDHLETELKTLFNNMPRLCPENYGLPRLSNSEEELKILEAYGVKGGTLSTSNSKILLTFPRVYLAGELYLHGKSLNWISGQARKSGDSTALEFHIFDIFFPHAKQAGHDMLS
ncbi:5821_t:CDS:1, partial [Funneliformis mosseae]